MFDYLFALTVKGGGGLISGICSAHYFPALLYVGPQEAGVLVELPRRLHPMTELPASESHSPEKSPWSSELMFLGWERDNKQT